MKNIKIDLSKQLDDKLTLNLKREKLSVHQYVEQLIEYDLSSRVDLGNGFYYHRYLDKLYGKDKKEIYLRKLERKVIMTLLEYEGKIVPVDELTLRAWERDDVSIFTFRNIINQIRVKTYYKIITNRSNIGYAINIDNT